MSCKHAEDVCQDCLEKVTTDEEEEITTEEEEEEVSSVSKKTSTQKANEIFLAASTLVFAGYVAFWNAKILLNTGDIAVFLAKSIFQNLAD